MKQIFMRRNKLMDMNDYRVVTLVECSDHKECYGAIAINKKHAVQEFYEAMSDAKQQLQDDGVDDWNINNVFKILRTKGYDFFYIKIEGQLDI